VNVLARANRFKLPNDQKALQQICENKLEMSDLNIKSSTIEKGLDLLKGFLEKAIGPSVEELGLGLSDGLRMRRFKNQLRNLERAKRIVEEHDINIKQINLKALFPYLEGVALEEDEALQEMWANLFVNYIDSERNLTMTVFPDILKHLSSNEVKMLVFMEENMGQLKKQDLHKETKNFPGEYSGEEIGNLNRLGLIEAIGNYSVYDVNKVEELVPEDYFVTVLGYSLLRACKR
jgi:hypothetical protein